MHYVMCILQLLKGQIINVVVHHFDVKYMYSQDVQNISLCCVHEKTKNIRPGPTQIGLYNHRRRLEA